MKLIPTMLLCLISVSSFSQNTLSFADTRSVATSPLDYSRQLVLNFKSRATINLPVTTGSGNTGAFTSLIGLRGWGNDNTGGKAHELAFGDDNVLYTRSGFSSWDSWRRFVIEDNNGNVGIGTGSPSYKLNVDPQSSGGVLIGNPNTAGGSYTSLILGISATQNGYSYIQGTKASGSDYGTLVFNPFGGTVAIGTNNSGGYKLAVKGAIHAQQVNIDLTGWADHVFKKQYNLRPLSEVKQYIDQYQHLPEMPNETELTNRGLDVSEMMKLQMQKIEELTLYLIEKDKELKAQRRANRKLNARVSALETRKK